MLLAGSEVAVHDLRTLAEIETLRDTSLPVSVTRAQPRVAHGLGMQQQTSGSPEEIRVTKSANGTSNVYSTTSLSHKFNQAEARSMTMKRGLSLAATLAGPDASSNHPSGLHDGSGPKTTGDNPGSSTANVCDLTAAAFDPYSQRLFIGGLNRVAAWPVIPLQRDNPW